MVHQHGISGKWVRSNGRLEAVHLATSHDIMQAGQKLNGRGSPYNHPSPDKHQLNVEESGIGQKEIEPKVRAQIQHGAPRFLV